MTEDRGQDPLEDRLHRHFAAQRATLPASAVRQARRLALVPDSTRRRVEWPLLATAGLALVAALAVVVGGGPWGVVPSPAASSAVPAASPAATTAATSPTATNDPSPSAHPSAAAAYQAGDTIRAAAAFPLTSQTTVHPSQALYVLQVQRNGNGPPLYELQHWGDLQHGIRPDSVIATVAADLVDGATEPYEPACPTPIRDIRDVAALQVFERLVCYGSRPITLTPVRRHEYRVMAGDPPWLAGTAPVDFFTALPYALAEGAEDIPSTGWFRVTGRFDDPSCGSNIRCRQRFHVTAWEATDPPASELAGTWRPMSGAPIAGRYGASGVWSGREFLVWGGRASRLPEDVVDRDLRVGAAYDPATDSWRTLPASPIDAREGHVAIWTDAGMLVWGGIRADDSSGTVLSDGAVYDPATDRWASIPAGPFGGSRAVWDGERLVAASVDGRFATYHPGTGQWTGIRAPAAADGGDLQYLHVLAGRVVLFIAPDGADTAVRGWRLGGEAWRPLAPTRWWALQAGPAVAAGDRLIALGQYPETSDSGLYGSVEYDAEADTWRELPTCDVGAHVAWTGTQVLGERGAFRPGDDRCLTMPRSPSRPYGDTSGREASAFAWTGREYLIWSGGDGSDYAGLAADGLVFRPDDP